LVTLQRQKAARSRMGNADCGMTRQSLEPGAVSRERSTENGESRAVSRERSTEHGEPRAKDERPIAIATSDSDKAKPAPSAGHREAGCGEPEKAGEKVSMDT
jgi:hypothetical protein